DRAPLAARPWLARDLGRACHRGDHQLGAAHRVRVPVRAVHGLRGLHPHPDPRGTRPHRLHRHRDHQGYRAHRAAGPRRRADHVPRLRGPVHRPGNRPEGDGHRPGRRDPARRHRGARPARARPGRGLRPVELVAAPLGVTPAADARRPGDGQRAGRGARCRVTGAEQMITMGRVTAVAGAGPLFLSVLAVHVVAVITGALAATAPKRRGWHTRAGTVYYWAITVVFATATAMTALRPARDYYL